MKQWTVGRYNRTVRYDWLAKDLFSSLEEVQQGTTEWVWTYNNKRTHKSLGRLIIIRKQNLHPLAYSAKACCWRWEITMRDWVVTVNQDVQ
ncbi:integrase core domain-containing protein [Castellaniella defragrans]|uniref:integrase core domain-containing protein n=1 Tax=Castellaniella defragrans TaxID=75697 RepID=UPI00130E4D2D|nr:integrase core domain-containing protein [Castellaniella defragrans]